jgi:hypothetical protein
MIRLTGLVQLRPIGPAPVGTRSVNEEELSGKQSKLDVDNDGKIEGEDLEKLRNQKNESLDEEEYDSQRDDRISRSMFGSSDDDYSSKKRSSAFSGRSRNSRPNRPQPTQKPAASAQTRDTLLQQKVKYKDAEGKEHEATVKSLLGYAKEHPGRKIAARMYAQHMKKSTVSEVDMSLRGIAGRIDEAPDNVVDSDTSPTDTNDDGEGYMAKAQLMSLNKQSGELYNMLSDNEELEAWIQSKITKASDYINAAYNYLQYEKNKANTIGNGEGAPADPSMPTDDGLNEGVRINKRK